MKRFVTLLILGLMAIALPATTYGAGNRDDSYYFIITVSGVYKDGVGYASRVIHYPGYTACKKYKDTEFITEAKRQFSNHLQSLHGRAFPYGENNNFLVIDTLEHSTTQLLKTRPQAESRLIAWEADQKEQGHRVIRTLFEFDCSNL